MVTRKDVAQGIDDMIALLHEVAKRHPDFVRRAITSQNLFEFIGAEAQAGNPAAIEVHQLAEDRGILDLGNWDGKT